MSNPKVIHLSDVARCPIQSLHPAHYRDDATCVCGEVCEWFLLCDRPATTVMAHPILVEVPICDRCRDKVEAISDGR